MDGAHDWRLVHVPRGHSFDDGVVLAGLQELRPAHDVVLELCEPLLRTDARPSALVDRLWVPISVHS